MYATIGGAFLEIWYVCIGSPDFAVGDHAAPAFFENNQDDTTMHVMLLVLFIITCFILLIHLLNMLIAIMGDVFAQNNEVAEKKRIQNFLEFINDNWIHREWALNIEKHENKDKTVISETKYLMVALSQDNLLQDSTNLFNDFQQ